MPLDAEAMVDAVLATIDRALGPVLSRLAAAEAQLVARGDPQTHLLDLTKDVGSLAARVKALEVVPPPIGPPGPPGPPGRDGIDGTPGHDGAAGMRYCGVYGDGKAYALGDTVTWAGSLWHCDAPTMSKPGEGLAGWTLCVKRGRDGKDGRP